MNTVITSKEAILKTCRNIISEQGISALNMRTLAEACNVSVGSLYNYFSGKDDLLISAIESVWQDVFHMGSSCRTDLSFPEYIRWIFESVQSSSQEYPGFFMAHSLGIAGSVKNKAINAMERWFAHMKDGMEMSLNSDSCVRTDAFSEALPQSEFIDFILANIIMLLIQKSDNCDILIEMIRRSLY